ncbi:MAG: hypothetical protein WC551_05985 [Patescibacteria group bacterium]
MFCTGCGCHITWGGRCHSCFNAPLTLDIDEWRARQRFSRLMDEIPTMQSCDKLRKIVLETGNDHIRKAALKRLEQLSK